MPVKYCCSNRSTHHNKITNYSAGLFNDNIIFNETMKQYNSIDKNCYSN